MQDRPDRHNSPLPPIQLPKVAIPSYLHPISTRSWRNGKEGGCWQPADLPMHRGAVPREGCFATLVGFPGHSPPSLSIPKPHFPSHTRTSNRPFVSGARCRLDICTSKGVAGPPGNPGLMRLKKGGQQQTTTSIHPSPDPISPGGGGITANSLDWGPQYIYSRG